MQTNQMTTTNQVIQIADYQPHKRNYNRHPALQVQRIAASLQMFGQVRSVVVWRNFFLAGHGVREGALALGWTELRADVLPDEYPEELALAYVAADNELGRLSDPDNAQLAQILEESRQYDDGLLAAIGYDDAEFDALLKEVERDAVKAEPSDAEPQISKADELLKVWGVKSGDLWRIGEHRLVCGDCTDPETVARVMGGERADMMFTDPPYNVNYVGKTIDSMVIDNDSMPEGEFLDFLLSFMRAAPLEPGAAFYVCSPPGNPETTFRNAINAVSGWMLKQCIVWVKDQFVMGRQDYHWRHESILYGWVEGAAHFFVNDRTLDTVWEIDRPRVNDLHPTMKPVEVPSGGIRNNSKTGELIYEPFAGSGTTLVACQNLSRRCRAIEISPAYCAVILQRMADAFPSLPIERVDG